MRKMTIVTQSIKASELGVNDTVVDGHRIMTIKSLVFDSFSGRVIVYWHTELDLKRMAYEVYTRSAAITIYDNDSDIAIAIRSHNQFFEVDGCREYKLEVTK